MEPLSTVPVSAPIASGALASINGQRRASLRFFAAMLVTLAAALLLALCSAQSAYAATSGTWGDCTWEIVRDTLTVEGEPGGALTGDVDSAPWNVSDNDVDMANVKHIVVGTESNSVQFGSASAEELFVSLTSVESINLAHFDTSNVTNMDGMFLDCRELTSLDLSNFNTSKAESMFGMFALCKKLTVLDLSSFDTSKVKDMANMFNECSALASLDLSTLNTSNVTDMSAMFAFCTALTSLDLSAFNTTNVTNMSAMFAACRALESVTLSSSFTTSNVTDMSTMFTACEKLTSLDLSTFNTAKVEDMANMFGDCSALTSLTLPASFTTSNVTDMSGMFQGCENLASLDLSTFNTSNVTNMAGMFNECSELTSVNLSSFNTSNVTDMAEMFYFCRALASLNLSSFDTSNVTNMSFMFAACEALEPLTLSDSFTTSNVTDMSYMFGGCEKLTSLDLSTFDTSQVTNMSGMFAENEKLTSLDLSTFNTAKVEDMSNMFDGCKKLTSLDLSTFDTSSVTNMMNMFEQCEKLTFLDLSAFKTPNVTEMSFMFYGCTLLTSLDLSNFETSSTTAMLGVFKNCHALSAVRLADTFVFSGPNSHLPYGENRAIGGLETLLSSGLWIDPQGNPHNAIDLNPGAQDQGAGWYLAEPKSGSYALFGWNVRNTAPTFVAADSQHKVTPPNTPFDRTPSGWVDGKNLPVDFSTQIIADKHPAAFSATWDKQPVTKDQFEVALPKDAVYGGGGHTAFIKPKDNFVGQVTAVRYSIDGTTWLLDAPVDAGTYQVQFDCAEGAGYTAQTNLDGGTFTIAPRKLDATVSAEFASDILQDTFAQTNVNVTLTGARIVGGASLTAVASKVTYLSAGAPGDHRDATVVLASLVSAPNYALPEGGLTLTNQAYRVTARSADYRFLEGQNGSWQQGSSDGLRFRVDADLGDFRNASLNGVLIDPSNYLTESGSTIVTLKRAYLETLVPDTYTLRLAFEDGAAETTFTVAAAPQVKPDPEPDPEQKPGSDQNSGDNSELDAVPPTGDPAALLALATAALATLAGIGLVVARRRG